MTALYRPVLIETAEQAEALPVDTLATELHSFARQKVGVNEWIDAGHAAAWGNTDMVGWTALVPIEAEEEWALIYDGEEPTPCADEADAREWARIDSEGQAPSRRYVTPWEEA